MGVALALLASKNEYKNDYSVIAHTFGISKSSVAIIFKQFCNAVVDILFGKVVQLPSGPGFREEADKFELRCVFFPSRVFFLIDSRLINFPFW